ncbi:MAG: glycosyltransferase family 9 protein [Pseudomonadota bacterium]|nr:glycosyltransferase family 9 protein [Pseudomonadota bacterium]
MKILFITSTRIGDAVLSTGLLHHLISKYPSALITVACGPLPSPLFASIPRVERVIKINKKPFSSHWISLWFETVTTSWDLVVDLRSSALALALRSKSRKILRSKRNSHNSHRVVELGNLFELNPPPSPKLWVSDSLDDKAEKLLSAGPPIIGLGVTANWMPKVWPSENFVSLICRLTKNHPIFSGKRVAVFGTKEERHIADPVLRGLKGIECVDLVGKASIYTAAACLKKCSIFIGNDSGLMHIAAALGVPTVGLFGPSRAKRYGPWGKHCISVVSSESYDSLVGRKDFDHRNSVNLMKGLSVNAVANATLKLYEEIVGDSFG